MSSIIERFQEPIAIVSAVLFVIFTLVIRYVFKLKSWIVSIIIGVILAGGVYLFYQDYTEKRRLEAMEEAKGDDLKRRIEHQVKLEKESGKCISCTADLPEGAETCPKCGYKVRHYSTS